MNSQKIVCPKCSHQFTWGDAQISEEQKAIIVLTEHGFSMRAIGRMMNLAPESIRYRIKEAKRHKHVAPTKGGKEILGIKIVEKDWMPEGKFALVSPPKSKSGDN